MQKAEVQAALSNAEGAQLGLLDQVSFLQKMLQSRQAHNASSINTRSAGNTAGNAGTTAGTTGTTAGTTGTAESAPGIGGGIENIGGEREEREGQYKDQQNIGGEREEREILQRECEYFQHELLLKRGEARQLAAHVSSLRHALHVPRLDSVERVRRGEENVRRIPDEKSLVGVRQRCEVYEQTKRDAMQTLEALKALL